MQRLYYTLAYCLFDLCIYGIEDALEGASAHKFAADLDIRGLSAVFKAEGCLDVYLFIEIVVPHVSHKPLEDHL